MPRWTTPTGASKTRPRPPGPTFTPRREADVNATLDPGPMFRPPWLGLLAAAAPVALGVILAALLGSPR